MNLIPFPSLIWSSFNIWFHNGTNYDVHVNEFSLNNVNKSSTMKEFREFQGRKRTPKKLWSSDEDVTPKEQRKNLEVKENGLSRERKKQQMKVKK